MFYAQSANTVISGRGRERGSERGGERGGRESEREGGERASERGGERERERERVERERELCPSIEKMEAKVGSFFSFLFYQTNSVFCNPFSCKQP